MNKSGEKRLSATIVFSVSFIVAMISGFTLLTSGNFYALIVCLIASGVCGFVFPYTHYEN